MRCDFPGFILEVTFSQNKIVFRYESLASTFNLELIHWVKTYLQVCVSLCHEQFPGKPLCKSEFLKIFKISQSYCRESEVRHLPF